MNNHPDGSEYGTLSGGATLRIERLLPGPIERIWAFLTEGDLRRKWLAAGRMTLEAGAPFEFVWRNDELSDLPAGRPEGFAQEQRMKSAIVEVDPPTKLVFTWEGRGNVSITLMQQGDNVLLTLLHSRLPDRSVTLKVAAGWHAHIDTLEAQISGQAPAAFWPAWQRLRDEYDRRLAK